MSDSMDEVSPSSSSIGEDDAAKAPGETAPNAEADSPSSTVAAAAGVSDAAAEAAATETATAAVAAAKDKTVTVKRRTARKVGAAQATLPAD